MNAIRLVFPCLSKFYHQRLICLAFMGANLVFRLFEGKHIMQPSHSRSHYSITEARKSLRRLFGVFFGTSLQAPRLGIKRRTFKSSILLITVYNKFGNRNWSLNFVYSCQLLNGLLCKYKMISETAYLSNFQTRQKTTVEEIN